MVRVALEMCVPDLENPTDIYLDESKKRLLLKKGIPLSGKTKALLAQNKIKYLEFPLPFEKSDPPPYTFTEELESNLFRLVRMTYLAYKDNSIADPLDVRKEAYDILAQAFQEFRANFRYEDPMDGSEPRRHIKSVIHLRTVGALEDFLFEHAKNVGLICLVLGINYFYDSKQLLSELHKVAVAGLFADIGMMKVPSRILKSDSKLTDEDWAKIHKHPESSAQFVDSMFRQENFVTSQIVLQHHERLDGSGYPGKLAGGNLTPYSKILGVVDSYCSMISKRYFRPAVNPMEALYTLNENVNSHYEEKALLCLNFRVAPYPVGSVAQFAGERLVQVCELENIPPEFTKTRLPSRKRKDNLYNIPKSIRSFSATDPEKRYKTVPIGSHLPKFGEPIDTFDLLALYGYTGKK